MKLREFTKFIRKHGCTIDTSRGKGSHARVERNTGHWTTLPMSKPEIGRRLLTSMLRDLDLKNEYRKEYG